jgi:hypothetical protein
MRKNWKNGKKRAIIEFVSYVFSHDKTMEIIAFQKEWFEEPSYSEEGFRTGSVQTIRTQPGH